MVWVYVWLGVVVISLILEFVTMELVSVWVSIGGFIGMVLALCGVNYIVQLVVAIVVSIACIVGLRKITLKFLNKNQDKTNMDLALGTHVKLLEDVTEEKMGSAKYNGVIWSVKCEDETKKLKSGTFVEIVKVEGNKLIVKKAQNAKQEQLIKENINENHTSVKQTKFSEETAKTSTKQTKVDVEKKKKFKKV